MGCSAKRNGIRSSAVVCCDGARAKMEILVKTCPVEECEDGVYAAFEEEAPHKRTVLNLMAEMMVHWGVRQVFGMVGHSNLG